MLRDERDYTFHELEAPKDHSNSFLLIREERRAKKYVWTRRVSMLFGRLLKRENKSNRLEFVFYMKCTPPLDDLDEAPCCFLSAVSGFRLLIKNKRKKTAKKERFRGRRSLV